MRITMTIKEKHVTSCNKCNAGGWSFDIAKKTPYLFSIQQVDILCL